MKKSRLLVIVIIMILLCCFCGCDHEKPFVYSGDNADLYTEAIHSILGARGYIRIPELGYKGNRDPHIEVVEKDSFGREMFYYSEGDYDYYLLILQKTEDGVVYYYPDYNFIIGEMDSTLPQDATTEEEGYFYCYPELQFRGKYTEKQIEDFLAVNDWEQELSVEKCVRQTVTRQKDDPLTNKEKNNLYKEVLEKSYSRSSDYFHFFYLTQDDEGKLLYMVLDVPDDYRMVIVTGGTQRNKIITDMTDYREELATFKQENGWKKS